MSIIDKATLESLANDWPGRFAQFDLLNSLLSKDPLTNPSVVAITGQSSSGKTAVVRRFVSSTSFSWIDCDECISMRVLLQRIIASMHASAGDKLEYCVVCSNFTAFVNQLNESLAVMRRQEAYFVVLDRIDELGEPYENLYRLLTRIGEMLTPNILTFILISSQPDPRPTLTTIFPHIYFPPYDQTQCFAILSKTSLSSIRPLLAPAAGQREFSDPELMQLWFSYSQIVTETFFSLYGSDISQLRAAARRGFTRYIQPLMTESSSIDPADPACQTRLVKLYKQNVPLLESERLVTNTLSTASSSSSGGTGSIDSMPVFTKYILCACYLASYIRPAADIRLFSLIRESKRGRRANANVDMSRPPGLFAFERMLAVLQSIVPSKLESNVDLLTQFATLATLKLVAKSSPAADMLDSSTRWRVNVTWDIIDDISTDIKFPIKNYLVDR
ncbi:origin recognition complex subunit 5 C-terminus-domain-containing protein [Lipomyces arxii]|uniref:origin recognition complex subunit 5 C-terminus-domain-containing protein n=1 Tax=Lipomyces arxii TaxID=56418 RepID=UPI0034CF0389